MQVGNSTRYLFHKSSAFGFRVMIVRLHIKTIKEITAFAQLLGEGNQSVNNRCIVPECKVAGSQLHSSLLFFSVLLGLNKLRLYLKIFATDYRQEVKIQHTTSTEHARRRCHCQHHQCPRGRRWATKIEEATVLMIGRWVFPWCR